jgi:tocopherol O-methyltransferase
MIVSARPESPATVASHYDDLDTFYRELWGPHLHHGLWRRGDESVGDATVALLEHLFADVPLGPSSRVCDVGCGYGETSRWLAAERGATVVGLTVSRAQHAYALKRSAGRENPRIVLQDWMQNDLPDASFDLVFSIESSEHMPDLQRFFHEAARVLRPGGALRVCAWLAREAPAPWERSLLLQPICTEGRLRLCTEAEYAALIEAAGLSLRATEDLSRSVKRTWALCVTRLLRSLATGTGAWRFLLGSASRNKAFALSVARILAAYETGSMRYVVFRAEKPA